MGYLEEAHKPENRVKFVGDYVTGLTDEVCQSSSLLKILRRHHDSRWTKPAMKELLTRSIRQQERFLKKFQELRAEAIKVARRENIPLPPRAQLPSERRQFKEGMR